MSGSNYRDLVGAEGVSLGVEDGDFVVRIGDVEQARIDSHGVSTGAFAGGGGGASTLNELTDVDTAGAVDGSVLKFSGGTWAPGTDNVGTGGGSGTLEFENVLDHGALGNGVADDTAAINAAIATGKPVFFPAGTYLISSDLVPGSGQLLEGAGRSKTTIKKTAGTTAVILPAAGSGGAVRRMTVDCNGHQGGIFVTNHTDYLIEDVLVKNTAGGGFWGFCAHTGAHRMRVIGSRATACYIGVQFGGGASDCVLQNSEVDNITENSTFEGMVFLSTAPRANVIGNYIHDGATCDGISLDQGSVDVLILGNRLVNIGGANTARRGINFTVAGGAHRARIIGNVIDTTGENAIYVFTNNDYGLIQGNTIRNTNQSNTNPSVSVEVDAFHWKVIGNLVDTSVGTCDGFFVNSKNVYADNVVLNQGRHGIYIFADGSGPVSVTDAVVLGNILKNNGKAVSGNGIQLTANFSGVISNVQVSHNRCFDDQATKTQQFGISAAGTAADHSIITENITVGNAAGGLSVTPGTGSVVTNNV